MSDSIKVLVVDDQALVRTGFRMILDTEPDIDVVGEVADGLEAIDAVKRLKPAVVMMDIRMPNLDGVEATRQILANPDNAGCKVLILTTFDLDDYVFNALRAGASGFLLKDTPPEELARAVRVVASGEALLAPGVTKRLIDEFAIRPEKSVVDMDLSNLTAREVDVLRLIAKGLSNSEIAGELVLGETTVKTHVSRVLMKLGLRDRVQAVVVAYESGLVQPGAS